MSVSSELMYAIMAMDAYNRGYNPGIAGLGGMGSQVGTATVGIDADDPEGVAQAAGFYAVAYQWNGETIISYRRTDSKGELLGTDFPLRLMMIMTKFGYFLRKGSHMLGFHQTENMALMKRAES